MDLKEKLIQLSEKKEVASYFSKELDEKVYYCKLNTKDGTDLGIQLQKETPNVIAKILIATLCDEEGEMLFKPKDIELINRMPISFTSEVSEKVNNTYLKSNMQEDGTKSYGRMVDLLIGLWRAGDI